MPIPKRPGLTCQTISCPQDREPDYEKAPPGDAESAPVLETIENTLRSESAKLIEAE